MTQSTPAVFRRYLTPAEERQLLRHINQYRDVLARRDHAWITLLRHTGVRIAAFSRLTRGDARAALTDRLLTLPAAIQKGRRGHAVPLNRHARAALRELLAIGLEMGARNTPDAPLVLGRRGARMAVRSYQQRMQHWREQAALTVPASPHWLRHTLGKRVVAQSTAGNPLLLAQAALGHRDLTSTALYTRPDREDLALAMEEAA